MTWYEAVEVVAWVEFLGGWEFAQPIMRWEDWMFKRVRLMMRDHDISEAAVPLIEANVAAVTADDGILILKAMQEGGWTTGKMTKWTKMALQERAHTHGESVAKQAEMFGLSYDRVRHARKPRKPKPRRMLPVFA